MKGWGDAQTGPKNAAVFQWALQSRPYTVPSPALQDTSHLGLTQEVCSIYCSCLEHENLNKNLSRFQIVLCGFLLLITSPGKIISVD